MIHTDGNPTIAHRGILPGETSVIGGEGFGYSPSLHDRTLRPPSTILADAIKEYDPSAPQPEIPIRTNTAPHAKAVAALEAEVREALESVYAELDKQRLVDEKLAQGILALATDTSATGRFRAWFKRLVYDGSPA